MCKVLCVDDDVYLGDLLQYALKREGYSVQVAHRGAEALQVARFERPDVVLLDAKLPDADGFELCQHFRTALHIPVIMVTGHHTDEDVIAGFSLGADDYIVKPFSMQILVYRLRALMRRVHTDNSLNDTTTLTYRLGPALFSPSRNEISNDGTLVKLTPTESAILHLLVTHKGQILPTERILERIWGYNTESCISVIKTHIHHLRRKIAGIVGDMDIVQTVPGVGYTCARDRPVLLDTENTLRIEATM